MRTIIRFFLVSLSAAWLWTLCPPGAFAKDKEKAKSEYSVREKDFARHVEIKGAKRIGSDQCQRCHPEEFKTFRRTLHSQKAVECESCHGPGSGHLKSKNNYTKIVKFSAQPPEAANRVCLNCHASSPALQHWFSGSPQMRDGRCTDCHRVHPKEAKPR